MLASRKFINHRISRHHRRLENVGEKAPLNVATFSFCFVYFLSDGQLSVTVMSELHLTLSQRMVRNSSRVSVLSETSKTDDYKR